MRRRWALAAVVVLAAAGLGGLAAVPAGQGEAAASLWIPGSPAYQPRVHVACHCPDVYGPSGRLPPPAPGLLPAPDR
jgi:hypothetical protein